MVVAAPAGGLVLEARFEDRLILRRERWPLSKACGFRRVPGVAAAQVECTAHLDLRYAGQQWTLTVPVSGNQASTENAPELRAAFNRLYEVRFGHSFTNIPSEVVNVRVIAVGRRAKPEFPSLEARRVRALDDLRRRPPHDVAHRRSVPRRTARLALANVASTNFVTGG